MDDSERQATLVPIGRFARLVGLTVPQLRHYDRRGLLPAVRCSLLASPGPEAIAAKATSRRTPLSTLRMYDR